MFWKLIERLLIKAASSRVEKVGRKDLYRNKVLDDLRNELDSINELILELSFKKIWFW